MKLRKINAQSTLSGKDPCAKKNVKEKISDKFFDSNRLGHVNMEKSTFSIANDFTFDDHLANLGCDVFSFDPR